MKTEESNKLIAEFMGYVNTTPTDKDFNIYENSDGKMLEAMSMKYHSSWDWLMPVWKKVVDIGDNIGSEVRNVYFTNIKHGLYVCDINVVFKAVVEFIEWYNKQKK
jgi:hypothetical protein